MGNRLKIHFLAEKASCLDLIEAIDSCGQDTDISFYSTWESIFKPDIQPGLIIVPFEDKSSAAELLKLAGIAIPALPVIFLMNKKNNQASVYKELTQLGAYGFVDFDRAASIVPHLISLGAGSGVTDLVKDGVSPKLLQFIIDSQDSMISVINDDLKYEAVNKSFCKNLGFEAEELVGSCPSKLWGDEIFKKEIEANLKKSLIGELVRYKAYFKKAEFSGKCYEVIYRPYRLDQGARSYSIVETRDITELENIKKMVERSDLRSYYIEKYLPFGVFDCTESGKIIYANETFYNILEVPVKATGKITLEQFFPTDKRFTEYLKSIKEGESSTFSQVQMLTGNGSEMFARISSHVRFDRDEGMVINAIIEDTTREVLLERKLGRTHRMETLGTMAGGIAHDFNTILTTIGGYSELTMEEVDPASEIYNYMSKVTQAVKRAETVINQMLTFSRQIDIEKIPVKIADVMKEAVDFMQSAIPYNIYLESIISDNELIVMADPTQLFRVLLNILTNSVQALEDKGGIIEIRLSESEASERRYADISISDNGSGIDKSIIDRIYEPFFTTKEVGKGSGMGLSVAHGIISGLGGELNVESTSGAGTCFTIRLPLSGPGSDINSHEKRVELPTIVYADENVFFSRTVSLALENLGYRVLLASNMKDMNLMLSQKRSDIDIFFVRCGLDSEDNSNIIQKIVDEQVQSRVVVITKPGATNHLQIISSNRSRVRTINEPVSLREILSAIRENC